MLDILLTMLSAAAVLAVVVTGTFLVLANEAAAARLNGGALERRRRVASAAVHNHGTLALVRSRLWALMSANMPEKPQSAQSIKPWALPVDARTRAIE